MNKFLAFLSACVIFVSCSSTTLIKTSDKDAKIYIDGMFKGNGSAPHTDSKIVGSSTQIKITKKGCMERTYMISRNEKLDVGALIGGIFLLVPFLWIMEYNPEHTFEYECEKA